MSSIQFDEEASSFNSSLNSISISNIELEFEIKSKELKLSPLVKEEIREIETFENLNLECLNASSSNKSEKELNNLLKQTISASFAQAVIVYNSWHCL